MSMIPGGGSTEFYASFPSGVSSPSMTSVLNTAKNNPGKKDERHFCRS